MTNAESAKRTPPPMDDLLGWMAQVLASASVDWPTVLERMAGWVGADAAWITAPTQPGQKPVLWSSGGRANVRLPDIPPPLPENAPEAPMGLPETAPLPPAMQEWMRAFGWHACSASPYWVGSERGWIGFVKAASSGHSDWTNIRVSPAVALLQSLATREQSERDAGRAASILAQSPMAVVITDVEGKIEYVNESFLRTTGYAESEVRGQSTRLLKSGAHLGAFFRDMWQTLQRGDSWTGLMINRRKNGEVYRAETIMLPIRDASNTIRWMVSLSRDVTREVEMAEEVRNTQKMEALAHLASGIAHDFNNTLTPILAYAEMAALETAETSPLHSYLSEIVRSAERGTVLTRHLLAFGKQHEPEMSPVELNEIVVDTQRLIDQVRMKNIEVAFDLDDQAGTIVGDAAQIEQAVMNLVLNALDAMPNGGTLRLRTKGPAPAGTKGAGQAIIEVQDNGHGIPDDVAAHMFDPFYTTKAAGEGTGLGLTTARTIMKKHEGRIEWETERGKGSRFRLLFPVRTATPFAGTTEAITPLAQGTETILLVEDDMGVRSLAAELLRRTGYTVYDFGEAVQALHFAQDASRAFDALVADLVLPDFNGLSLYQQMAEARPGLRVLFMTGYGDAALKKMGVDVRAYRVLRKPFTIYELSRHVRQLLDEVVPGA